MRCTTKSRVTRWHAKGFTLVEVLVTLAIVAILAAIAVPSMTSMIRDARLSAQTDALVSMLNTARLDAIKRRSDITVCPSASDADTSCGTTWATGLIVTDASGVIQRLTVNSSVTMVEVGANTTIVFNGTIGSAVASRSFTLCAKGAKQQQVDVAMSGHVAKQINTTVCL